MDYASIFTIVADLGLGASALWLASRLTFTVRSQGQEIVSIRSKQSEHENRIGVLEQKAA